MLLLGIAKWEMIQVTGMNEKENGEIDSEETRSILEEEVFLVVEEKRKRGVSGGDRKECLKRAVQGSKSK